MGRDGLAQRPDALQTRRLVGEVPPDQFAQLVRGLERGGRVAEDVVAFGALVREEERPARRRELVAARVQAFGAHDARRIGGEDGRGPVRVQAEFRCPVECGRAVVVHVAVVPVGGQFGDLLGVLGCGKQLGRAV